MVATKLTDREKVLAWLARINEGDQRCINKEKTMNRKHIALLGNILAGSAIITIIVFGFYGSVIWGLCGGINQMVDGLALSDGVETLRGTAKIMCCGTIAVLAIYLVQVCLRMVDRLHAWKLGR